MSSAKLDLAVVREQLWRRGNLSWMLDKTQKELYDIFHETDNKVQTWMLPRRFGKSRTLLILAIEQAIKQPGSIIKFLSPTKKQVERNIRPLVREILETCPNDIKPELKKQDDIYYFPNGSELQMAGSESGNIDTLRGGFSHICIVDEAQDVSDLGYAVSSVLLPTTITTAGKVLIAGTPPKDYDHDFLKYVESAEKKGILIKRTVYDNPRLTKRDIELLIEEIPGGANSEDFKREFLCEIFKSTNTSVVPEFTDEKMKECVKEWQMPPFYNAYVAMDLGFKDWTVLLFGYYDFREDKIIIQDEIVTHGNEMHLAKLGQDIIKKENDLWTDPITNEFKKPLKRVSDHDLIAINEIKKATAYKIIFEKAEKKEKMAGINNLRTFINSGKIIISPRCKVLIHHLRNGRWNKNNKEELARCSEGSHYDAIPALAYFCRAIDFRRNPYPFDHGREMSKGNSWFPKGYGDPKISQTEQNVYKQMLNLKKRA
jgi:hypothetical protein